MFGVVLFAGTPLASYSSSGSTTVASLSYVAIVAIFLAVIIAVVLFPKGSGRGRGIILGLLNLVTIFVVPFGTADSSTLYGKASTFVSNLGTIQSIYSSADQTYAYVIITAFILLVIAGAVGLFPVGAGFLGVVGMALITVAPYAIYPHGPTTLDPGPGYFITWAAAVALLAVSFRHRGKKAPAPTSLSPIQDMAPPKPTDGAGDVQPAKLTKCPNCGTMNDADAVTCSRCGYQFFKAS